MPEIEWKLSDKKFSNEGLSHREKTENIAVYEADVNIPDLSFLNMKSKAVYEENELTKGNFYYDPHAAKVYMRKLDLDKLKAVPKEQERSIAGSPPTLILNY